MLKEIIAAARLSPEFCAALVRVPVEQFCEWMDDKKQIPGFAIPELCAVLGVTEKDLLSRKPSRSSDGSSVAPAIWFKLRDNRLGDSDREFVGLVRRLGFSMTQLDDIRNVRSSSVWSAIAQSVSNQIDRSSPPALQGSEAAARFRSIGNLEQGQVGIGELIRRHLRQSGLVVIESPITKSSLEGCCFEIGTEGDKRPCVFSNTFRSTWFRRNEVIMHEVCHAIFDLANDPVSLDFVNEGDSSTISEERARSFSQECLLPRSVLVHYANQFGIKWNELTVQQLSQLVANTHVEQRTIVRAAYGNGLITDDLRERYDAYDCAQVLRSFSTHSLTTREYMETVAAEMPKWIARNRTTSLGTRRLRLPAGYMKQIIELTNAGEISFGKAAEMCMMDRYTFAERFGDSITEPTFA
jgi:Zn-dependent peptidase ImmA (M78 family)